MPAISELWIDYPISYRDEKGRFVKGHNYGFKKGRKVSDEEREKKRVLMKDLVKKRKENGSYLGHRNNTRAVIAIEDGTNRFLCFEACCDCERKLGMPQRSCSSFCKGKNGHRWRNFKLFYEDKYGLR